MAQTSFAPGVSAYPYCSLAHGVDIRFVFPIQSRQCICATGVLRRLVESDRSALSHPHWFCRLDRYRPRQTGLAAWLVSYELECGRVDLVDDQLVAAHGIVSSRDIRSPWLSWAFHFRYRAAVPLWLPGRANDLRLWY